MPGLARRKSSYSASGGNGECVELAAQAEVLLMRESDQPEAVLTTAPTRLAALLAAVKAGRLER
ncbi:DUF397 domain-containing protein [Streptomyces sp. NBC_01803]|uniref:DUF397 domain-containing protein n=1 Tax=Streptomyces sp. NBC_01803 TaxID=2975946 RepID=UPI002DD8BFC9|nr:DUF397 domain-containing protein [Streptomyces sp. NBC_01803]